MKAKMKKLGAVIVTGVILPATPLYASGFDNLGIGSMDMLFDPARASIEFGYTYVDRNVDYKVDNAHTYDPSLPEPIRVTPVEGGAKKARATPNVWNYTVNAKVGITDNIDCLARLNNPGTIEEVLPDDWNGRKSIVVTDLQTLGLDATCSYKVPVMDGGFVRVIGGARYIEAEIYNRKESALGSLADVNIKDHGFGWRAGLAFEYPEYAIRASLFYDSAIDLDMKGTLETNVFGNDLVMDTVGKVTMPQGVEFRIQSGIAPAWLAFMGVKWVDWSVLQSLALPALVELPPGGPSAPPGAYVKPVRYFNFSDGWTVTAGIGHQLTDSIQIGSSLTWDQGIGTSYSDTYSWGLGGSWNVNEKVKFSLGGVIAYKLGAKDRYPDGDFEAGAPGFGSAVVNDRMDLSYDASWNFGIGTKLKIDF